MKISFENHEGEVTVCVYVCGDLRGVSRSTLDDFYLRDYLKKKSKNLNCLWKFFYELSFDFFLPRVIAYIDYFSLSLNMCCVYFFH